VDFIGMGIKGLNLKDLLSISLISLLAATEEELANTIKRKGRN